MREYSIVRSIIYGCMLCMIFGDDVWIVMVMIMIMIVGFVDFGEGHP